MVGSLSQTHTRDIGLLESVIAKSACEGGLLEKSSQNTTMVGGDKQSLGRSSVKYAQTIQRLCIIERSK